MPPFTLAPAVVEALFAEARARFPREACGVVIGRPGDPGSQVFHRMDNLADRLHEQDPTAFPRDARTAYAMHPLKLERLVTAAEARGEALLAICHSHPDHPAYFSATDQAAASPFGAPSYPDAVQLVVSVFGGEVRDLKGFVWDGAGWPEVCRFAAWCPPLDRGWRSSSTPADAWLSHLDAGPCPRGSRRTSG